MLLLFILSEALIGFGETPVYLTTRKEKDYCPVNQVVTGPLTTGWFSYPLDIYNRSLLYDIAVKDKKIINCTSIEVNLQVDFSKFRSCSNIKTCPVHRQNLVDALKKTRNWLSPNYLCEFTSYLHNASRPVNIVILGGSASIGQFTEGYYCESQYDVQCSGLPPLDLTKRMASWGRYLEAWFMHLKMNHVKVHFLQVHGYSSAMMNEVIVDKLHAIGLRRLSSSDIVMIDHSFNDGLYLNTMKVNYVLYLLCRENS